MSVQSVREYLSFANNPSGLVLTPQDVHSDDGDRSVALGSGRSTFSLVLERELNGIIRWTAEINLLSQFISNKLRAAEIDLTFPGVGPWFVRNPDFGDLKFTPVLNHRPVPGLPVFNKHWLFFSDAPAAGTAPVVQIAFKLTC